MENENIFKEFEYMNKLVTKEEFIDMYMGQHNSSYELTKKFADEVYEELGKDGGSMTRFVAHSVINIKNEEELKPTPLT